MPLKPIFDKAPLTALACHPLRAGMARVDYAPLRQLYQLVAEQDEPLMLEGVFRLACLVSARPAEEPVTEKIRSGLQMQKPDGSFELPIIRSIALLRAGWALYEYEARKPLLEHIAAWFTWAARNWERLLADEDVWANPADLLELLENLYRVTGKAALLTLCDRLSSDTMAWSNVLNTVAVQRAVSRDMDADEMRIGMVREAGDREGYYTQFERTHRPEDLADGARAALARGWYSGSATEMGAVRNGWEKLQRWHGAICGGLTADELLAGTSPSAAVSSAALGAWAEALAGAVMAPQSAWAWDALERMLANAVPAATQGGSFRAFQWVNCLKADPAQDACFMVRNDHGDAALRRMCRGVAAAASSAVTLYADGFGVNLMLPGRYAVPVGDGMLMLTIAGDDTHTVTVHARQEVKAVMRLRIPAWSRSTEVLVNGAEATADCNGSVMSIERTWHDGDVVTVKLEKTIRVMEGHHQGRYVLRGAEVLVMPAEGDWNCALLAVEEDEEHVRARVAAVDWKAKGDLPADVPVLPETGAERVVELTPYASASARIALFPGRKNG